MALFVSLTIAVFLIPILLLVTLASWRAIQRRRHKKTGYPKAMLILAQTPGNHSPRAYAHATAALTSGLVSHILYVTESPGPSSSSQPNIHFIPITKPFSTARDNGTSKKGSLTKFFWLGYHLYHALVSASQLRFHVTHIVVNTPPILPTLCVAGLLRLVLFPDSVFVLDVHNLGFSLMRLTSPKTVVRVATVLELISIRLSMLNGTCWTVSYALAEYLRRHVGVRQVTAVHDRPRTSFFTMTTTSSNTGIGTTSTSTSTKKTSTVDMNPISIRDIITHEATKLYASDTHPLSALLLLSQQQQQQQQSNDNDTLTTTTTTTTTPSSSSSSSPHNNGDNDIDIENIPMIVSSSSWTPDEDFSLLSNALRRLDVNIPSRPLLFVLTGKGPNRAFFEQQIDALRLQWIAVAFTWLPLFDYPRVLARAKVGVCLHTSSSGLDLPMKAVDLLAARTPVIALRYHCIEEVVKPGETGVLFDDDVQLCAILRQTVFPENGWEREMMENLKRGVDKQVANSLDWDTCWQRTALTTLR